MKYLLLLLVFLSFVDAKIYRDGSKDVVLDDESRLMWVDDISVIKTLMNHDEAEKYCQKLSFLGFSDWRLAHIEEFERIVYKKNTKTNIIRIISDILLLSCFVFFYSFYSISVFSCFYTIIPYISSLYIIIPYKDMHCYPDRPRFHCLSMPDSEADSSQSSRIS